MEKKSAANQIRIFKIYSDFYSYGNTNGGEESEF